MIGKASSNQIRPVALGATVQSATYGQTIPICYGRTKGALYLTWAANLRQGGSNKTAKKILTLGLKKGAQGYVENVDLLLAHNPVAGVLQFWENQTQILPLSFTSYTQSTGFVGPASIAITDPLFYAVIGVTISTNYGPIVLNDYGGQGPISYSGNYEIPCWNQAYSGPNPTDPTVYRMAPYVYLWLPGDNTVFFPYAQLGDWTNATAVNIYYAKLDPSGASQYNKKSSGTAVPSAALRLTFEPVMGDGPEYYNPGEFDFRSQQILYPHYCGLGSPNIDLGASSALPQIQPEVQGSFPIYSTGDGDFADMIEDTFNGATQAGFFNSSPRTPLQHGLNCQDFPGTVQKVSTTTIATFLASVTPGPGTVWNYPLPNTAGNFLVVAFQANGGTISGISDTAGNSWTPVFGSPSSEYQVWYATALAYSTGGVGTTVTISWTYAGLPDVSLTLFEIAGVDTLDSAVSTTSGNTLSVVSATTAGNPAYLLAFGFGYTLAVPPPDLPLWKKVAAYQHGGYVFYDRRVNYPGTYSITFPQIGPFGLYENVTAVALLAFSNSQPVAYPKPLGDILDHPTLDLCRQQCRAAGLYGSLLMDSQQAASDSLKGLYQAMDAGPVWSGFVLKSIPYSERSAVGNGAIYVSPTSSGPVYDLTEADFVVQKDAPPVSIDRTAQIDVPNLLQIQHPSRDAEYNDVIVSQPETAAIALYTPRKDSPQQMRMFQDPAVARMVLGIMVRKQNYLRNDYSFTLPARFKQLEAMDLVTIPLSATIPNSSNSVPQIKLPVRLTSVEENEKFELACHAEDFIYATYAPVPLDATSQVPYTPQTGGSAGNVNSPVIFEPNSRLAGEPTQGQVWMVVSNRNSNFGGSQVYLSTDGGGTYTNVGGTVGNGTTGALTAAWPQAADPDTTNDLSVNLTESLGALEAFDTADEDAFQSLCYVAGQSAASFVQKVHAVTSSSSAATLAFGSNNTAGNTIILIVTCVFNEPGLLNPTVVGNLQITDTRSNVYQLLSATPRVSAFGESAWTSVYLAYGIAAGSNTITVTPINPSGAGMAVSALEYFGVGVIDAQSTNGAASSSPINTNVATPTTNGDLSVSFVADMGANSSTITTSAGWTQRDIVGTSTGSPKTQAIYERPAGESFSNLFDITGASGSLYCGNLQLNGTASGTYPGVVQSEQGTSTNSTTCTATFDNPNVSGHAIVVSVGVVKTLSLPTVSVTDSKGNTYALVTSSPTQNQGGVLSSEYVFVAYAIAAGSNTVTVTLSTSSSTTEIAMLIHEVANVGPPVSGSADGFSSNSQLYFFLGSTFSLDSGSVALKYGDFLFTAAFNYGASHDIYTTSPPTTQALQTGIGGSEALSVYSFFRPADGTGGSDSTVGPVVCNGSGAFHVIQVAFHNPNAPVFSTYELMAYGAANLTSTFHYTLPATGAGNKLRRAVYGQPAPSLGESHPSGARFAYIGIGSLGIFKYTYDPSLTGSFVNFKILSFNSFLGALQSLTDVPATAYKILGTAAGSNPNSSNYVQTPADALSNPSSTSIAMAQVTVAFPSNSVNYNARTLTIPVPSIPTQYYVTIYDPGYVGDTGALTNLTAYAETTQAKVAVPGYTYIGSIIALPTGGGTTVTPGGLPLNLGGSGGAVNFVEEVPAGTIDGSNATFTLSFTPNPAGSLFLFLNGVEQIEGTDFTISGAVLVFTVPPKTTDDPPIAQYTH